MSSGWFDCTEPSATISLQGIQGVQGAICTGSGFDCTEPSPMTSLQGIQGVQGAPVVVYRLLSREVVQLNRTFSIYFVIGEPRCAGYLGTSSGWFKHIESPRTFLNHIITEIARCGEFWHMSSGWFDCTEFSLSTLLQWKQGVQGSYTLVRGGSSTSNLLEPSQTTSSQR